MALDPRIDAYIEKAAPFAQPILRHFRRVVHGADREGLDPRAPYRNDGGAMWRGQAALLGDGGALEIAARIEKTVLLYPHTLISHRCSLTLPENHEHRV